MSTKLVRETKLLLTHKLMVAPNGGKNSTNQKMEKEKVQLYVKLHEEAYFKKSSNTLVMRIHKLWEIIKVKFAQNDLIMSKKTSLKKYFAIKYNSFSLFLTHIHAPNQKISLSSLSFSLSLNQSIINFSVKSGSSLGP
ncbi:hypothetical protein VP01_1609g9 [Puccinia sorghi]|uniref:Uncharacterized protein n=1 Tax=Puccinia sorghi TaxID=27349 RepID=A0A0L6VJ17_9BASI|nr:hypothetical protein VP01_1609g9 [Puccinia sorghi]